MSKDKKTKTKISPAAISLFIVFGLLFIGLGIFFIVRVSENKSKATDYSIPSDYSYEVPDIEEYFSENSTVLEVVSVIKSPNALTEQDLIKMLEERGLYGQEITTSYSINGEFKRDLEVSSTSSDKHPMYETFFVTENDVFWLISVVDGSIMATPSFYNIEHSKNVPIIVSESNEIISYDDSTNSFYRTIPNEDVINVRVVDKINAQTLESFDLEG